MTQVRPSSCAPWTAREDARLLRLSRAGLPAREIARAMKGRTAAACSSRLTTLTRLGRGEARRPCEQKAAAALAATPEQVALACKVRRHGPQPWGSLSVAEMGVVQQCARLFEQQAHRVWLTSDGEAVAEAANWREA